MSALWHDGTVERFPDRTCHGADEIRRYFEDTFVAIPDLHVEIVALAEQGDDVFVQWHLTGAQQGRLQGLEPTGRQLALDGVDHFTLREGKIDANFVVYDQTQWGRQIGLIPPDGSPADRALKAAFNARAKLARRIQARRTTS